MELCLRGFKRSLIPHDPFKLIETTVLFRVRSRTDYLQYQQLERLFPQLAWRRVKSFYHDLLSLLQDESNKTVLCFSDSVVFNQAFPLQLVEDWMEHAEANDLGIRLIALAGKETSTRNIDTSHRLRALEQIPAGKEIDINAMVLRVSFLKNMLINSAQDGILSVSDLNQLCTSKEAVITELYPSLSVPDSPPCACSFLQPNEKASPVVLCREFDIQQKQHAFDSGMRLDEVAPFESGGNAATELQERWIPREGLLEYTSSFQPKERTRPIVSVIIPCFNYGRYVAEAVLSVQKQTLSGVEIIVVDGGSNDDSTLRTLTALEEAGVRVLYRKSKCFAGSNRNYGIEHSSGDFILCLDADDMIEPTYLEKALYRMLEGGYDVVGSGALSFGASEKMMGVDSILDKDQILEANGIMSASLFRKPLWRSVGGYEDFGIGETYVFEDWHFWCKCALAGAKFCNIEREYLIRYRVHGEESLSRQKGTVKSEAEQGAIIREKLNGRVFQYNTSESFTQELLQNFRKRLALARQSSDFLGNPEKILILLPIDEPSAIYAAQRYFKPYIDHGHELVVAICGKGKGKKPVGNSASSWITEVFDLYAFLDSDDQRKDFLMLLIDTHGIRTVFVADLQYYSFLSEIATRTKKELTLINCMESLGFTPEQLIPANEVDETREVISLTVLPTRNPDTKGNEVWLLDVLDAEMRSQFVEQLELLIPPGWSLKKGNSYPRGIALVAEKETTLTLNLKKGSVIRLLMHAFSGQIQIEKSTTEHSRIIDLYAESGNIFNFSLESLSASSESL